MTAHNRFAKGSGVYRCRVCNHNTRNTGGDGAGVELCDLCYDLSGEENYISDNNGKACCESAENVKALLVALDKRNGPGAARKHFPTVCDSVGYQTTQAAT